MDPGYDKVMEKLEDFPEDRESEYVEAVHDALHTMKQFTDEDIDYNVETEHLTSKYNARLDEHLDHFNVLEEEKLYRDLLDTLEKSSSFNDFLSNVKRKKAVWDAQKHYLEEGDEDRVLEEAQRMRKETAARERRVRDFTRESLNLHDKEKNEYEMVVVDIIWPAVKRLED